MKISVAVLFIFLFTWNVYPQEFELFGPRAGIGYLNKSGESEQKEGLHSAFGWQIEVPYKGENITGYGEAGLYILAIEQSNLFLHFWGYFGARYKNVGMGAGPVFNANGAGLGINSYYQIVLNEIRIPLGVDLNFIKETSRIQLFIGFNYN